MPGNPSRNFKVKIDNLGCGRDMAGMREEDEKRGPAAPASTEVAEEVSACTREPAASADMPGAGVLMGTGEEAEGKATQIADIGTHEQEEKREAEEGACKPAASTEGEEVAAAELAVADPEELLRKLTEGILAERYTIPVEAFAAGASSGCALVGSIEGFDEAARTHRPFFLMPYVPPKIAVEIQSEMEKQTKVLALLTNPDMLACKVAAMEDIDAQLRICEQEENRALAKHQPQHHRIASDLISFRSHMQHRLLFAYAAKGEWDKAQTYLKQLYPEFDVGRDGQARMKQFVTNLKCTNHCSDEAEFENIISDLTSLLSMEEWTGLLYKCQCSPISQQSDLLMKGAADPSLIGATNTEMAVSALKKLQLDLVSCAIAKGHLADETGSELASKDSIQKLRKDGGAHINGLSRLLEKKILNFDKMTKTIILLKELATEVGGKGLQAICDTFIELCEQKNEKECTKAFPKIQQKYIDTCSQIETISELKDLIGLLESRPTNTGPKVAVDC